MQRVDVLITVPLVVSDELLLTTSPTDNDRSRRSRDDSGRRELPRSGSTNFTRTWSRGGYIGEASQLEEIDRLRSASPHSTR